MWRLLATEKNKVLWWYLAIFALYYYSFVLEGMEVLFYTIFYGVPIVYLLLSWRTVLQFASVLLTSGLKYAVYIFFLLLVSSIWIPMIHGTADFSYLGNFSSILKHLVKVLFLMVLFVRRVSPSFDWRLFMRYFIWATCCYVLGTCVFIALPDLKQFWFEHVKDGEHARASALQASYYTRYGWAGFSGFNQTYKCLLALIMSLFLIGENPKRMRAAEVASPLILTMGTLFYGRIGFLGACVVLFAFFLLVLAKRCPRLCLTLAVVFVLLVGLFVIILLNNDRTWLWFEWAFALFIDLASGKGVSDGSIVHLFRDMYFMPTAETLCFGDGYYTEIDGSGYYMNTDVGFLRPILFGGLLFCLTSYSLVLSLGIYCFDLARRAQSKVAIDAILIVFLMVIMFEAKGEVVFLTFSILAPLALMHATHLRFKEIAK